MTEGYRPARKGTILIPTGAVNHLHFICSDPTFYPATNDERVLIVNISTLKEHAYYDRTCILDRGDHPFIKHPSFVYYREALISSRERLSFGVETGVLTPHDPFEEHVIEKVLHGFSISQDVKYKVFRFYERYC